jgi:hypothetical protein
MGGTQRTPMKQEWEEDPVRNGLWWLMRHDRPNYSSACACIGLVNGSFRGFVVGATCYDEDSLASCEKFNSLAEAQNILEEARV